MDLLSFVITVIVVTASGALAPGQLFFGLLIHGSKEGAPAGFSCAIGHTLVEFPLVLALSLGLLAAASEPTIKGVIGLVGGMGLIGFGALQIYNTIKNKPEFGDVPKNSSVPTSSLMLGLALTGLNPYFILWWLTIGSVLIVQALTFAAIVGVLIMYISHVWMDYAYLTAIAHLGKRGKGLIGSRYYKLVLIAFGLILIYYGSTFILNVVRL
jgi:threonine/homoserine/homoserine lactone efflux protein